MTLFTLGIIIGILLALIVFLVALIQKPKIERALNQLQSAVKEKGRIIEPQDTELTEWVDTLKEV